jgi:hypothetical protein
MTPRIPQNFSTWLVDWNLIATTGGMPPPRDPNDDDDDDDDDDDEDDDADRDNDREPAVIREPDEDE